MKTTDKKLITDAYSALYSLNNISWTPYRDRLFDLCVEEEREHRGSRNDQKASVPDSARMLVVRDIAAYLTRADKIPSVKGFISYKRSCYMAASLVLNYRKEIRKAWRGFDLKAIAALDYCKIISE